MTKSNKLSAQEGRDHTRLEQVVSQSIHEAQQQLLEIERTGLWRSTHKTFEEYCLARFGFNPFELNAELLSELADKVSPPDATSLRKSEEKP